DSATSVVVADSNLEVALDLPPPPRSEWVALEVKGPDGRPTTPRWVQVDVERVRGYGLVEVKGGARAEPPAGDEPAAAVRIPVLAGEEHDRVTIRVNSTAFGMLEMTLPSPTPPRVVAQFDRPAAVDVALEGLPPQAQSAMVVVLLAP